MFFREMWAKLQNGRWKWTRFGPRKNDMRSSLRGGSSSRWNRGMEIVCSISPIQTFVREEPCTLESQDGSGCHAIAGCCSRSHCETLPGRDDLCFAAWYRTMRQPKFSTPKNQCRMNMMNILVGRQQIWWPPVSRDIQRFWGAFWVSCCSAYWL